MCQLPMKQEDMQSFLHLKPGIL